MVLHVLGHSRLYAKIQRASHYRVGDVEDLSSRLVGALVIRQVRSFLIQRNAGERISLRGQLRQRRLLRSVIVGRRGCVTADLPQKGGKKARRSLTARNRRI